MDSVTTPADFTGYWVLSRVENLDDVMRAVGYPWVVRKAATKFATQAVEVIAHDSTSVKVTTLNPKGSWTRTYDTDKVIEQPNFEGVICKTTSWWEGSVFHSRIEGSTLGVCESWRYRRGDVMVVRTCVKPPRGAETSVYWFFERMQALQLHLAGSKRSQLLKQIYKDQQRVVEATKTDNAYLQKVLPDWERWSSPADEFIKVNSPKFGQSGPSQRFHLSHRRLSSPLTSPQSMSKTPSTASLSNLAVAGTTAGTTMSYQQSDILDSASMSADPTTSSPTRLQQDQLSSKLSSQRRVVSSENLQSMASNGTTPTRRAAHYRSPSAESLPGMSTDSTTRATPVNPKHTAGPPSGGEALMAFKMHEFLDGRGIMSVVPVATPNDTSEPQLLEMSPEQAEETAAKLRELETDMLLKRQENVKGCLCCGFVIAKEKDALPEHLRVWEMTLA